MQDQQISGDQQQQAPVSVFQQGREALARTVFDPTLRQIQAELFAKERAAIVADQALQAAEQIVAELLHQVETLRKENAELEATLAALGEERRIEAVVTDIAAAKAAK